MGTFYHGDPDWYLNLTIEQLRKVSALLHVMKSEDPFRHQLPIPLTAYAKVETEGMTLTKRAAGPSSAVPPMQVKHGKAWRAPESIEAATMATAADRRRFEAMAKDGTSREKIDFWFTRD